MTIELSAAHGVAISDRRGILQQAIQQFQLLRGEDKRHVDACIKTAGHDPDNYATYDLRLEKGRYYLDLQEKPSPPPAPAVAEPPIVQQTVNGTAQPEVV